jgi:hypothetical protein
MTDFSDSDEVQRWFAAQPPEVCLTFAARSALRLLPIVDDVYHAGEYDSHALNFVLPFFRAVFVLWAVAKHRHVDLHRSIEETTRHAEIIVESAWRGSQSSWGYALTGTHKCFESATQFLSAIAIKPDTERARLYGKAAETAMRLCGETGAHAFTTDSFFIEKASTPELRRDAAAQCLDAPLWPTGMPSDLAYWWPRLKERLLRTGQNWDTWVDWYEDRLAGRGSIDPQLDIEIATLPDDLWKNGAVNARVARLIKTARVIAGIQAELVPAQDAGPHFIVGTSGLIALAQPSQVDAGGDNLGRIRQLLPLARRAADDLAGHINPNAFRELARDIADYRAAIADDEAIAWGTVFGLGVMLENAAIAAEQHLDDPMWPRLEDTPKAALNSLLTLHGPLILATAEGRELADAADRMRLTRAQQEKLRVQVEPLAEALKNDPEVIEKPAAELVERAARTIGEGPHAERGTVFGLAAIKNVSIVLVGAAVVTAAATAVSGIAGSGAGTGAGWLSLEALKKSKAFLAAAESLGGEINRLVKLGEDQADLARAQLAARLRALAPFRNFVIRNEKPLRQIAANTSAMRWMLAYINFIIRSGPPTADRFLAEGPEWEDDEFWLWQPDDPKPPQSDGSDQ